MGTRTMWRVRQGAVLVDPKSGAVVAYAGQDVPIDHPAALASNDCYRVEVEDAPFDSSTAPSPETTVAPPAAVSSDVHEFDLPEPEESTS